MSIEVMRVGMLSKAKSVCLIIVIVLLSQFGLARAGVYNLAGDGYINWADIEAFTEQWLDDCLVNDCGGANFNSDNTVNFGDLALLAPLWQQDTYINTYYVAPGGDDDDDGSITTPFATVQKGIDVIQPGDCLYLRGGTYNENVTIPHNKQGDEDHWFTVKSYPGEWAIIDAQHSEENPVIKYASGGYSLCPSYWIFESFEITGGGIAANPDGVGCGIKLDTATHMTFRYLYIHDNYGGAPTNNAGLMIAEDSGATHHTKIQWCHIKDNREGQIRFFTDYIEDPTAVDPEKACRFNEISYNLLEGDEQGIYYKNGQWLTLDHSAANMTYKDYGDHIHHNIIIANGTRALGIWQDFVQVYNNILASNTSGIGRTTIGEYNADDREPFHACFYNNTLIKAQMHLSHHGTDGGDNSSYGLTNYDDYHPNFHFYNNIIESAGPEYDGKNDLNLLFSWDDWVESDVNMATIHMENNYFWPRTRTEEIINIAYASSDYTADEYVSAGYATTIYANETPGLHKTGSDYKTEGSHVLDGSITIADGGTGGAHPYLSGVTLPDYVGATDPDNDGWVDDVLALADLGSIAPGKASIPSPTDTDTDVSITADLNWTAGSGATSSDVYFGTTSPGTFQDSQTETTFDTGTMTTSTTYYWRIDEVNPVGTTTGDVWSFTTEAAPSPPGQASNPSPGDSATDVAIDADLSWTAGTGATSHDVYFGTTSPGASQGNQTATTFDTGTMDANTTYYWRIDEINPAGTTTGDLWSFTTTEQRIRINFEHPVVTTPAGYERDSGLYYGDRGNSLSYGWDISEGGATTRWGTHPDVRYDSLVHFAPIDLAVGRTWEIALDNGTYDLWVVCSDPEYGDFVSTLDIEGTVVIDPDGKDKLDEFLLQVEVLDGRLTIAPHNITDDSAYADSNTDRAYNSKIAFIEITAAP